MTPLPSEQPLSAPPKPTGESAQKRPIRSKTSYIAIEVYGHMAIAIVGYFLLETSIGWLWTQLTGVLNRLTYFIHFH